jgi:uncharacterized protein YkwD
VTRRLLCLALVTMLGALGAPLMPASAAGLAAPASACPGQLKLDAPTAAQEQAMLCMTNFARERLGQPPLEEAAPLAASAAGKGGDILLCDNFSHNACGREFNYWIRASGYLSSQCWQVGENLAWGTGPQGTVGSIFRAWMRSPTHRANLLGNYTQIGVDLETGTLEGHRNARVWTQHFGSHCE